MDEPLESVGQGFDDLQQRAEQAITRANDRIARSQAAIERDGETQLRERAEQQRHELARQWAVIRASREPTDIQRRQDEAIAQSQELIKRAQELRGPFPATTSAPGGQQPSAIRDEDPSGGRPPGH